MIGTSHGWDTEAKKQDLLLIGSRVDFENLYRELGRFLELKDVSRVTLPVGSKSQFTFSLVDQTLFSDE